MNKPKYLQNPAFDRTQNKRFSITPKSCLASITLYSMEKQKFSKILDIKEI